MCSSRTFKTIHEMTHPTLHQKQVEEDGPKATEKEFLATSESGSNDKPVGGCNAVHYVR